MDSPDSTKYLTVRELADTLQVHPQSVYHMVRCGLIPHLRVGGQLRFILAEVESAMRRPPVNAGGDL